MSILSSTICAWEPFEASLLEWRRLCKRMEFLDSSRAIDADRDRTHLGEVLWGIELKEAGLNLDPVFTLKAWRSLLTLPRAGALKDKKVLFWNTYNSFDNAPLLLSSMG